MTNQTFTVDTMSDGYEVVAGAMDSNHCEVIKNVRDLGVLSLAQLVNIHNTYADKHVNRFSDRAAGERRTYKVLLAAVDFTAVKKAPEKKVPAKPAKKAKAAAPAKPAKVSTTGYDGSRGTDIAAKPLGEQKKCREGTKQQLLIDMLSDGSTLAQLIKELGTTKTPWTASSVKTGFSWDVHSVKGYGVRTVMMTGEQVFCEVMDFDTATEVTGYAVYTKGEPESAASAKHPDDATAEELEAARAAHEYDHNVLIPVYHLVLPEGMESPLPSIAKQ